MGELMPDTMEMDLGTLGKVLGKITLESVIELESRLGALSTLALRSTSGLITVSECAVLIEGFARAAAPKSSPTLTQVQAAVWEMGITRCLPFINPFLARLIAGEYAEEEKEDEDKTGPSLVGTAG